MKQHTDIQLKQSLARMLPDLIKCTNSITEKGCEYCYLTWLNKSNPFECECRDTELLHLCWLVEETLNEEEQRDYQIHLYCMFDECWTYEELKNLCFELSWTSTWDMSHTTWQQRTIALAKVKGIEIV